MPRRKVTKARRKQTPQRSGLYIIGGVVLIAVIAVVLLIISNPPAPVVEGTFTTVEPREWPMADGKALGPADAPVVLQEFSDFQCPWCRRFHETMLDQIVDSYVSTGKVRFEYHHFIVIDSNVGGSESRRAAQASECASEQGKFWDYYNMLFTNQKGEGSGAYSDARLREFAKSLGLNTDDFNACFNSNRFANRVTIDEAIGKQLGVQGTPALFVNGKKIENPLDFNQVKAAIDEALGSANQ